VCARDLGDLGKLPFADGVGQLLGMLKIIAGRP